MKYFRYILAFSFLLIGLASMAQPGLSRLVVRGNQFVNEQGDVVVLRGFNTSDPDKLQKQGKWSKTYFEEIKRWGANVVRFPVHPRAWSERGEEAYLQLLDMGIKWAGDLRMYVIIDWHSIGNLRSQLFHADMYDTTPKQTFEFWQTIGEKYGDNSTVAFYELFNEPTTFNGKYGQCSWEEWKKLNEEMIGIIKANGGKGIPLVAGFNWAYDLSPVISDPIQAEGIGYVSHPYPQKREKPWEDKWTADWGFVKENYPVILTEIGFSDADAVGAHVPVISDESYGEAITAYCDDRDISYVVWVFDAEWSPRLISDWNYTPYGHGNFFKKKISSYAAD